MDGGIAVSTLLQTILWLRDLVPVEVTWSMWHITLVGQSMMCDNLGATFQYRLRRPKAVWVKVRGGVGCWQNRKWQKNGE